MQAHADDMKTNQAAVILSTYSQWLQAYKNYFSFQYLVCSLGKLEIGYGVGRHCFKYHYIHLNMGLCFSFR